MGRRASAWVVVAAFLGVVALPPFAQAVLELADGEPSGFGRLATALPDEEALRALEDRLEERSVLVQWAHRRWAAWVDRALGRGSSKVLFGRDGWLFYRDSLRLVAGPPLATARAERLLGGERGELGPLEAVSELDDQLADRGIALVVVPVPVKATLYPERLWPGADPLSRPENPGTAALFRALAERGIAAVDVTGDLLAAKAAGTEVFLPRDTHWSPAGAAIAAAAVAREIRSRPDLARRLGPTQELDRRRVVFDGRGDLYDMLTYAEMGSLFPPMELVVDQVIATRSGQPPFPAPGSPLLLLGDSLTAVFSDETLAMGRRGGFAELLAAALGQPLDVVASPGGGANVARRLLALEPERLAGKRLVVWQLTQRDLAFARGGWQRVEVPTTQAATEIGERESPAREVLAWIVAVSEIPTPFDYEDCLVVVRNRLIGGQVPADGDGDFFTLEPGWRDWERVGVSLQRPRTLRRLRLEPLPHRFDLDRACWVDGVNMSRRPWWVAAAEVE